MNISQPLSELPQIPAPIAQPVGATALLAIDARQLNRTFAIVGATVQALVNVDLAIAPKEIVAIIGRSGAGKSTLLNLIGALDRQYQGELRVFGQELKSLSDAQLSRFRNRQIGFVFQAFQLLPNISVGENVMLPAYFGSDLAQSEIERRARWLLGEMELSARFDQNPQQMSGGERQRVAIARALLLEPPLLVCDEPTGSLDAATAQQILQLFNSIRDKFGTTLVMVTHDPSVAAAADRVITLDRGLVASNTEVA